MQALELSHSKLHGVGQAAVGNGMALPSSTGRQPSTVPVGPAAAGRTGGSRARSRDHGADDHEVESPPQASRSSALQNALSE